MTIEQEREHATELMFSMLKANGTRRERLIVAWAKQIDRVELLEWSLKNENANG